MNNYSFSVNQFAPEQNKAFYKGKEIPLPKFPNDVASQFTSNPMYNTRLIRKEIFQPFNGDGKKWVGIVTFHPEFGKYFYNGYCSNYKELRDTIKRIKARHNRSEVHVTFNYNEYKRLCKL